MGEKGRWDKKGNGKVNNIKIYYKRVKISQWDLLIYNLVHPSNKMIFKKG